jgi:hypothetical protein
VGGRVDGGRQPIVGRHVGDVADQQVVAWSAVDQVAVLSGIFPAARRWRLPTSEWSSWADLTLQLSL